MAEKSHIRAPEPTVLEEQSEVPSLAAWGEPRITREVNRVELLAAPAISEADELLEKALATADRSDQLSLAERINGCFDRISERGGSRAAADFLLKQLESGRLNHLEDGSGATCRAAAVRALIGLGYPYALEVLPEDLEFLRREQARSPRFSWGPLAVALTAGFTSGLAAALGFDKWFQWPLSGGLVVGGLLLSLGWPGTRRYSLGKGLLAAIAAGGMLFAIEHPWSWITAVGSALVLGFSGRRR